MKEAFKDYFFWICMIGIGIVVAGVISLGLNGGR